MATDVVKGQAQDTGNRRRYILWLAGRDIRRTWLAYLASAGYLLLMGALLSPQRDYGVGTWSTEAIVPIITMILTQPFFSRDYLSWDIDRVAERLTFLGLLPIPMDVIVGGRMLTLIVAAVLNVHAFFVPMHLLGEWGIGAGTYVWFVLFWTGIAIAATGYGLCMEMATSVKRYTLTNVGVLGVLIAVITVLGAEFDIWSVEASVELVTRVGPVAALASLAIGTGVYVASGRVATGLLRRRKLTP
jgi:hypothetical protein